ncbi:putative addiction module antidote protein [Maribrevibacterium harenarium]|uniref:Putative addiction module antidote protein n=1 Tax=Maribrevibacterium harenarium TaxID=2589817 RepID=A0A501X449_9GAMM|nr:addiction module antidote protein [Maribrevibacterium harenarium]TPE55292.1 putative addiction module antidote protein [Maribrevibacterium harenarium]
MTTLTSSFDIADYLESDEDIQAFLLEAIQDGSSEHLLHCLNVAAKAKGMTEVAKQAGVTRASLYKSLTENANPKLDTIVRLLAVFNCQLSITPLNAQSHQ